jgi:hypothetical protein
MEWNGKAQVWRHGEGTLHGSNGGRGKHRQGSANGEGTLHGMELGSTGLEGILWNTVLYAHLALSTEAER